MIRSITQKSLEINDVILKFVFGEYKVDKGGGKEFTPVND